MALTVGLTYDLKTDYTYEDSDPGDIAAEFDAEETVNLIAEGLKESGNNIVKMGNVNKILANSDNLKGSVDIVFNICEGLSGRNREAQVPVILEALGIPFVGSDGLTLSLTLDKAMTKKILISDGIPTPKYFVVDSIDKFYDIGNLEFPLIVKPQYEGSSKGLSEASRVEDAQQLKNQVDYSILAYKQPALVEEFIRGAEFTVPIIGNSPPKVFPPVQVHIGNNVNLGDRFYTNALIYSDDLGYIYPADIDEELKDKLCDLALKTYKAVDCYDFGRVDFRVDAENNPYVLEINPLPCLDSSDAFNLIAQGEGVPYSDVLNRILNEAVKRYGLIKQ